MSCNGKRYNIFPARTLNENSETRKRQYKITRNGRKKFMNYKEILNKKTKLVILPILLLLIATLIALGITNAAANTTEPETDQTFTEEGNGYYIWVRAVDHAGNKRTLERSTKGLDRCKWSKCASDRRWKYSVCFE